MSKVRNINEFNRYLEQFKKIIQGRKLSKSVQGILSNLNTVLAKTVVASNEAASKAAAAAEAKGVSNTVSGISNVLREVVNAGRQRQDAESERLRQKEAKESSEGVSNIVSGINTVLDAVVKDEAERKKQGDTEAAEGERLKQEAAAAAEGVSNIVSGINSVLGEVVKAAAAEADRLNSAAAATDEDVKPQVSTPGADTTIHPLLDALSKTLQQIINIQHEKNKRPINDLISSIQSVVSTVASSMQTKPDTSVSEVVRDVDTVQSITSLTNALGDVLEHVPTTPAAAADQPVVATTEVKDIIGLTNELGKVIQTVSTVPSVGPVSTDATIKEPGVDIAGLTNALGDVLGHVPTTPAAAADQPVVATTVEQDIIGLTDEMGKVLKQVQPIVSPSVDIGTRVDIGTNVKTPLDITGLTKALGDVLGHVPTTPAAAAAAAVKEPVVATTEAQYIIGLTNELGEVLKQVQPIVSPSVKTPLDITGLTKALQDVLQQVSKPSSAGPVVKGPSPDIGSAVNTLINSLGNIVGKTVVPAQPSSTPAQPTAVPSQPSGRTIGDADDIIIHVSLDNNNVITHTVSSGPANQQSSAQVSTPTNQPTTAP